VIAALIVMSGSLCGALAQESPTPLPFPPAARSVRISFAPPPIEGTISLGIYDPNGKLVRVLHRESETDDFIIGHDALITEWDGRNDASQDLPAGKYNARGYALGALAVEGVAYFFNDWVRDENSPHIVRIIGLALNHNELSLAAYLASGEDVLVGYDLARDALIGIAETRSLPTTPNPALKADEAIDPIAFAPGRNNTLWVVDHPEKDSKELEVKQLSATREILRRLSYQAKEPQPKAIVAAPNDDKIFVLEENSNVQRVRGLTLIATTTDAEKQQAVSDWKVDLEKKIVAHKDFSLDNGKPIPTGRAAPEKIIQKLQPNPLKRDERGSVELAVGVDSDGSYLKTSDGLPLRTISDTPNISRALLISHGDKAIDVFQYDGAVVEQFRISGTDQMMAFDCGDFELK
jgi:hypothetical protein